jgi:hypothetical protein
MIRQGNTRIDLWLRFTAVIMAVLIWPPVHRASAQTRAVRLEVVASPDLAITAQHEWLRRLGQRPFAHVRIRTVGQRTSGSRKVRLPSPSMIQLADGSIEVTGVITARNQLALPGLTVSHAQLAQVDEWIAALTAPIVAPEKPTHAFGLSAEQLVSAHNGVSAAVEQSTAGRPASDVFRDLQDTIELPFIIDPSATKGLEESYEFDDELQGLSVGTALAAALRPLGLVMYPRAGRSQVEWVVADSQAAKEFWPIGWPLEGKADELAPELFEFIPVDIKNARLLDALSAIRKRLTIPLLFDHNGLARAEIELEDARVTVPATKTYYKRVLERVLASAKLKGELRVDEGGRPFFWISPRAVAK